MPTLRILADGRSVYATPGRDDLYGVPAFVVGGSEAALLKLDFTAWLQGATVSSEAWVVNGGTITPNSIADGVASALVTIPNVASLAVYGPVWGVSAIDILRNMLVTVGHTLTASDGRIKQTPVRLSVVPAVVVSA